MILSRSEFWSLMRVKSLDLFPPALTVGSRTGRGQIIRARSHGADLWTGTATLAPHQHADVRMRRALMALAQQADTQVLIDDPAYTGHDRTGVTLYAISSDNRTLTLAGLAQGFSMRIGDDLSIGQAMYTVTSAAAAASNGRATVAVMPHLLFGTEVGAAVNIRDPEMLAVIDNIRPATFEAVIAGEASFTVTQVIP